MPQKHITIVVDVSGGVVQTVWQERAPGVLVDVIVRDYDNVACGDPLPEVPEDLLERY